MIRQLTPEDVEPVVQLSLRAWAPVFDSLREVLGDELFELQYPATWPVEQRRAVEAACTDEGMDVWVADVDGKPVGFVAVVLRPELREGEIHMVAVDPDHHRQGIGALLTDHALTWMADRGVTVAIVETGGDPGHAPARATYEHAGFTKLSVARYFKAL